MGKGRFKAWIKKVGHKIKNSDFVQTFKEVGKEVGK